MLCCAVMCSLSLSTYQPSVMRLWSWLVGTKWIPDAAHLTPFSGAFVRVQCGLIGIDSAREFIIENVHPLQLRISPSHSLSLSHHFSMTRKLRWNAKRTEFKVPAAHSSNHRMTTMDDGCDNTKSFTFPLNFMIFWDAFRELCKYFDYSF